MEGGRWGGGGGGRGEISDGAISLTAEHDVSHYLQHAFPAKIYRVTSTLDKVVVILHPKKSIKLT